MKKRKKRTIQILIFCGRKIRKQFPKQISVSTMEYGHGDKNILASYRKSWYQKFEPDFLFQTILETV
jgi:hypothetical protein